MTSVHVGLRARPGEEGPVVASAASGAMAAGSAQRAPLLLAPVDARAQTRLSAGAGIGVAQSGSGAGVIGEGTLSITSSVPLRTDEPWSAMG
jgi:hypothetical protein